MSTINEKKKPVILKKITQVSNQDIIQNTRYYPKILYYEN